MPDIHELAVSFNSTSNKFEVNLAPSIDISFDNTNTSRESVGFGGFPSSELVLKISIEATQSINGNINSINWTEDGNDSPIVSLENTVEEISGTKYQFYKD